MATAKTTKDKKEKPDDLQNKVRETAQKIFLERTSKNEKGDELSDWLTAEKMVKEKHKK
jgi:hypothetical protein